MTDPADDVTESAYLPGHSPEAQHRMLIRVLVGLALIVAAWAVVGDAMGQSPAAIVEAMTDGHELTPLWGIGGLPPGFALAWVILKWGATKLPAISPKPADGQRLRDTMAAVIPERGDALDVRVASLEDESRDISGQLATIRADLVRVGESSGRIEAALIAARIGSDS